MLQLVHHPFLRKRVGGFGAKRDMGDSSVVLVASSLPGFIASVTSGDL
jgi:hypothetical protein